MGSFQVRVVSLRSLLLSKTVCSFAFFLSLERSLSFVPGIGVPAVALSGASAANSMISPWKQWACLDDLKANELI